jgi:hypothetical protein
MVTRLIENSIMVGVIIFTLALVAWAPSISAQSADKAIIAHTSESISLAPGVKNQVAANDLVDFQILRDAAKDIDGKS